MQYLKEQLRYQTLMLGINGANINRKMCGCGDYRYRLPLIFWKGARKVIFTDWYRFQSIDFYIPLQPCIIVYRCTRALYINAAKLYTHTRADELSLSGNFPLALQSLARRQFTKEFRRQAVQREGLFPTQLVALSSRLRCINRGEMVRDFYSWHCVFTRSAGKAQTRTYSHANPFPAEFVSPIHYFSIGQPRYFVYYIMFISLQAFCQNLQ